MKEPKIRFKGFQGEWEIDKIGNFSTSFSGGTPNAGVSAYYGGNIPFIRSGEIHEDKTELSLTEEGYNNSSAKIVERGTLLYALYGATSGDVAISKIRGAINQAILAITPYRTVETDFLADFLLCNKYKIVGELLQGGQGNLSGSLVKDINVAYPCISEQQSIASYFQHLDSLIQSTTKKIESLKQVKAASLQSMFPQEGETTPRVRFKGFEGEWSICPLKYFAKKSTEKNISMDYTITLTNSAEYGVINQRDFFDHDISNDDHINGYYIIHHDDFVYNPRVSTAAPVGPISRNRLGYSGVMSPLYLIFRVNGINKDFLSYYFKTTLWHNYMKLEGNTGARFDRLAISDEQFFNMPIYYPKDEEEQTAIASYFTNLDRQITLHTQRLEKLKQIKSACLDNMFV